VDRDLQEQQMNVSTFPYLYYRHETLSKTSRYVFSHRRPTFTVQLTRDVVTSRDSTLIGWDRPRPF